jgi:hypothetical protein
MNSNQAIGLILIGISVIVASVLAKWYYVISMSSAFILIGMLELIFSIKIIPENKKIVRRYIK